MTNLVKTLLFNTLFIISISSCEKEKSNLDNSGCDTDVKKVEWISNWCQVYDTVIVPTSCHIENVEITSRCSNRLKFQFDRVSTSCALVLMRKNNEQSVFDTLTIMYMFRWDLSEEGRMNFNDLRVDNELYKYTYKFLELHDSTTVICTSNELET